MAKKADLIQEWDLEVTGQDRKWKAGKGMLFKVTLKCEDPKVSLTVISGNPELFKKFPEDETFTVRVMDQAQQRLQE